MRSCTPEGSKLDSIAGDVAGAFHVVVSAQVSVGRPMQCRCSSFRRRSNNGRKDRASIDHFIAELAGLSSNFLRIRKVATV